MPVLVWAVPCLVLAGVWLVVWPGGLAAGVQGWQHTLLRWGHALAWLLLALSAVLASLRAPGAARLAALGALAAYVAFLVALVTARG